MCNKPGKQLNPGVKCTLKARLSHILSSEAKLTLVRSFIVSNFKFCPTILHYCSFFCSVTGLENKVSQDWLLGALSDKLPWMIKAHECKNPINLGYDSNELT